MKKILFLISLLIFPAVSYSGSLVHEGYLFIYEDESIPDPGPGSTWVPYCTVENVFQVDYESDYFFYERDIITWAGNSYCIHCIDGANPEIMISVSNERKSLEELHSIFGKNFSYPQRLYKRHDVLSLINLVDSDGDCLPDFLDPMPNQANGPEAFRLGMTRDCDGKVYEYQIMVDSDDGEQLNIAEPVIYRMVGDFDMSCYEEIPEIDIEVPRIMSGNEIMMAMFCVECADMGFINGNCGDGSEGGGGSGPGGGSGDSGGGNDTDPGGGSGGSDGGGGNDTFPGGGSGGSGDGGDGTDPGGGNGTDPGGSGGNGTDTGGGGGNGTDTGGGGSGGSGGGDGGNGTSPGGHKFELSNSTLFDVEEERQRAEEAKAEFLEAWDDLKSKVSGSFVIAMDAPERLPKWTWNILGHIIIIDLNIYKDVLKYIGIMLVLICFIIALFVVFGD